jgi:uncharacterized membrane protein
MIQNLVHVASAAVNDLGTVHPVIVHFPIVLLCVAPLFIIAGLSFPKSARLLYICALSVMLLGTAAVFLATASGDAASEAFTISPDIFPTLRKHVLLAEQMRLNISILSGVFFLYVILRARLARQCPRLVHAGLIGVFLIFYAMNLVVLFNAAHYGGKLVHYHGIQSTLYK